MPPSPVFPSDSPSRAAVAVLVVTRAPQACLHLNLEQHLASRLCFEDGRTAQAHGMSSSCRSHIQGHCCILVLPPCSANGTGVTPLSCVCPTPWETGGKSGQGTVFKFRSLQLVFKVLNGKANFEACQNQFNLHGAAPRDWEASGYLGPQTCSAKDNLYV